MSLAGLSKTLPDEKYQNLQSHFPEKHSLLTKKGYFPYSYLNCFSKFDNTEIPKIEEFTNKMTGKKLTKKQYSHVNLVWKEFSCKNLLQYHNIYLLSDTLILADVFEHFRNRTLEVFKLDPVRYLTLPSLSYDAMLSFTKVTLERIRDIEIYTMIERGIRGGVSVICRRYGKANLPGMPHYNPEVPKSTLLFLDFNALYSHCMTKYLPVGAYEWVSIPPDILDIPPTSKYGYLLEVSLSYPTSIHDKTSCFPLCPERLTITEDMLSPYQRRNWPQFKNDVKLAPNQFGKTKYLCHYLLYQFWIENGMKLEEIHRVLKFEQKPFISDFINYNMSQREIAVRNQDHFGKIFYKDFSNIIFGKFCENVRLRKSFELINNKETFLKRVAKPNFREFTIFTPNLVAVSVTPTICKLDKLVICGFSILELSKLVMYHFHYKIFLPLFPGSQIILSDTDSYLYHVPEDAYEKLKNLDNYFDFSNFDPTHPLFNDDNLCKHGYIKDEMGGEFIYEVSALRSKLYSLIFVKRAYFEENDEGELEEVDEKTENSIMQRVVRNKSKMKGISVEASKKFTLKDFEDCRTTMESKYSDVYRIGQNKHQVFTYKEHKKSISCYDTKRFILPDGITTLPHGHYKTLISSAPSGTR